MDTNLLICPSDGGGAGRRSFKAESTKVNIKSKEVPAIKYRKDYILEREFTTTLFYIAKWQPECMLKHCVPNELNCGHHFQLSTLNHFRKFITNIPQNSFSHPRLSYYCRIPIFRIKQK